MHAVLLVRISPQDAHELQYEKVPLGVRGYRHRRDICFSHAVRREGISGEAWSCGSRQLLGGRFPAYAVCCLLHGSHLSLVT